MDKKICKCGKIKDYRSKLCATCARTGYSVNKKYENTNEEILKAIKTSYSYLETSSKLKMSRFNVTKYIKDNNIDISHFKPANNRPYTNEEIFTLTKQKIYGTIKKRVIEQELIPYKCKICDLGPKWNNQILALELDHKDGNPLNNVLSNLRFLCPNCHSQAPTSKGKKRKERNQS